MEINKVAQVGAGYMGGVIAQSLANTGLEVWLADVDTEATRRAHERLLEEAEQQTESEAEDAEADPLVERAVALALELKTISISMLQRRLRVGYPRAARIMDALEERGITPVSAEVEYVPLNPVHLPEDQATKALAVVDQLEQDDDVQKVFHNLA